MAVEKFEVGQAYRYIYTGAVVFDLEIQEHDYSDENHSAVVLLYQDGEVKNWALQKAAFEKLT